MPGNYSTNEVDTGYTWVDGKPIYKRTFTGTITQAGLTRATIELMLGVSDIVSADGYFIDSSGAKQKIGSVSGADNLSPIYSFSYVVVSFPSSLRFITRSDGQRTDAPYAVTVLYTKIS